MRKNNSLSFLFTLIFSIFALAQNNKTERFAVGIYTEPQHFLSTNSDALIHWDKADGFNIGAGIELQGRILYVKFSTYAFPNLNDIPYYDFDLSVGYNWRSFNDSHRLYTGGLIGLINRKSWGYPKVGVELGYQFHYKGFYTGIKVDFQEKHDDKLWRHNASGHSVWSTGIQLGYTWYYQYKR